MAYTGTIGGILSNYEQVLKTFYLPAIQEQLNQQTPLADLIETNEKDVSGKNATILCHYGRSGGTFARADGGAFGDADRQKFQTATVPMKYQYGRVVFSGPTIAATRDEKGSYARVIDTEITGIVKDLQQEVNRQLWGCGMGVLARWETGATSATSVTLSKLYRGNAIGGDGFGSTFGAKYLKENGHGVAVVVTSANPMTAMTVATTDIAVSAVDDTSSTLVDTITCTATAVSNASGTWFVRPGNMVTATSASVAGAWRLEMMGLRGIVTNSDIDHIVPFDATYYDSAGTNMFVVPDPLQGLTTGTYSWWKAQVSTHASGRYQGQRALTLDLMQEMFDNVETAAGKDYGPNVIFTTKAIRRKYLTLMQADRRNVNTMTLDGGWKALDYNGIPLMVDDDAIDGEMYFLTTKDLQIYRMSDYEWMQKDGAVLSRITGYDAYEAVLYRYAELGCVRRNSHGVICDLSY